MTAVSVSEFPAETAVPVTRLWCGGSQAAVSAGMLASRIEAANNNAHPGCDGAGGSPTPVTEGSDHA